MLNKDGQDVQKSGTGGASNRRMNRRHVLKLGGLAAGVTAVAAAFRLTPFSPTHAASPAAPHSLQAASLEGAQGQHYIQTVLASADYQRFQQQLHQKHPGVFTPQEHAASVIAITSTLEEVVSVRVPIAGGAGHSFYTAAFQGATSAIIETRSGVFTPSGQNIAGVMERNGKVVLSGVATRKGKFVRGTLSTSNGKKMVLDNLTSQQIHSRLAPNSSNSNTCCIVNGLVIVGGLDIFVAIFVLPVCAVACAVTLGSGCAACIIGAAGVGGAEVGIVLNRCSHDSNAYLHIVC